MLPGCTPFFIVSDTGRPGLYTALFANHLVRIILKNIQKERSDGSLVEHVQEEKTPLTTLSQNTMQKYRKHVWRLYTYDSPMKSPNRKQMIVEGKCY